MCSTAVAMRDGSVTPDDAGVKYCLLTRSGWPSWHDVANALRGGGSDGGAARED